MALYASASIREVTDHHINLHLTPKPWYNPGTLMLSVNNAELLIEQLSAAVKEFRAKKSTSQDGQ